MQSCPMHSSEKDQDTKPSKGCCDDQSDYLHSDTDQLAQGTNISLELAPKLVGIISVALALNPPITDLGVFHYLNYKPPLIIRDFTVSLQTFLC